MSNIETIEAAIVVQLQTISYLAPSAGGTVQGVSDLKTYIDLIKVPPPAVIVMFAGERAKDDVRIGKALQETTFLWATFLLAASFSASSEGRLGAVGAYQMADDVIAALLGFTVTTAPTAKMLLVGSALYAVGETAVVYDMRWRHQFVRQEQ